MIEVFVVASEASKLSVVRFLLKSYGKSEQRNNSKAIDFVNIAHGT